MAQARKVRDGAESRSPRRNREDEVIQTAIEVFHRKGFAAASVQDVADRVGVLKGSLYYYIDSKEDLLFRIFEASHAQAIKIIEDTSALEGTAIERLRHYFESYVLWYLRNIARVSLYFNEWHHLTGERLRTAIAHRKVYEKFAHDLIDEAKAEGSVGSEVDTKYLSFFLQGAINGVHTWYRGGKGDSPEKIAKVYGDLVMTTLTGRRPA